MPAGGNTVYNYELIQACNQVIFNGVKDMNHTAEIFKQDVKKLVEATWGGVAAGEYEVAAGKIQTDLDSNVQTLNRLGTQNGQNADDMSATDKKGGGRIGQV